MQYSTSPCKNCSNRHVGCHANCEPFLHWKTEHDVIRERVRRTKEAEIGAWLAATNGLRKAQL